MNALKHIVALALLVVFATSARADGDEYAKWGPTSESGAGIIVRAGYTIGAVTPLPIPAEIRSINAFKPNGGATIGFDVYKMLSRRWGMSCGWHFFYEGFYAEADVKNYKMSLTMEGNTMAGYFTGTDVTDVGMWGLTMPLLVTFRVKARWNISMGPYFTVFFKQTFDGDVYDNSQGVGYLRVDDITGEKVNIDRSNPATYDFSDNMRNWNGGIELSADYKITRHLNAFGKLDFGLSNIIDPDFDAIEFKMYPIYGTVGIAYRY